MPELAIRGYEIGSAVASGGMSKVYSATQLSLRRPVAIKYLDENLIDHPEARQLFEQESVVIAQLNHPNIIQVLDKGIDDEGHPYFVMELVKGVSLYEMLRDGMIPEQKKYDFAVQICRGLACAHRNGIIHRDIKLANILVDEDNRVRLLDFGIAILRAGTTTQSHQQSTVIGTARYLAPEIQQNVQNATLLSDLYSLGLILLDLFTNNADETKDAQFYLEHFDLNPDLRSLIEECLAVSPDDRPSSADVVRDKLLKISAGDHIAAQQRQEAPLNSRELSKRFRLLDIIKKNESGAVYIYQRNESNDLLIVRKRKKHLAGLKEARLLSSLKHANIANVHGVSKDDVNFITVMDYMPGGNLQQRLARRWSLGDFIFSARQMCAALQFAHNNNIYHGNLRPSNVLFDSKDNVKLSDFGFSPHYEDGENQDNWYRPVEDEPSSMARDIFGLGALFHHMLTAEAPLWIKEQSKPVSSFKAQPKWLRKLISAMLELDSKDRIHDVNSVLRQLEEQVSDDGEVVVESPTRKIGLTIFSVSLTLLGAYAVFHFFFPDKIAVLNEIIFAGLT